MVKRSGILAGLVGAVFGVLTLVLTTPDIGRDVLLVAPPDIISTERLSTLTRNLTEGLQFGLATFLVWSAGGVAWAQRRARPLLLGAVVATTWILIGVWLQRMLLNLFNVREEFVPWGFLVDVLFVLSAGTVTWFIAATLRPVSVGTDNRDN